MAIDGIIHVAVNESIGLACEDETMIATNINGKLMYEGLIFDLPGNMCRSEVKSSVLQTDDDCSGGKILNVFYNEPKFGEIYPGISPCFDMKTESVSYIQFQLDPTIDCSYKRKTNFYKDDNGYPGTYLYAI